MLQLIAKPSFLLNQMVRKQMGRKGVLLSELEFSFKQEMTAKNIKLNNQTYLWSEKDSRASLQSTGNLAWC